MTTTLRIRAFQSLQPVLPDTSPDSFELVADKNVSDSNQELQEKQQGVEIAKSRKAENISAQYNPKELGVDKS